MKYEVFLTHSEKNLEAAEHVADVLRANGIKVTLAQRVRPAKFPEMLSTKIQRLMRRADCVVALLTEEAVESPFVNQEVGFALQNGHLIPIVEHGVHPAKLGLLQGVEYILLHPDAVADAMQRMLEWTGHLKLKKEQTRDVLLMIGGLILVALGLWLLARSGKAGSGTPQGSPFTIQPGP